MELRNRTPFPAAIFRTVIDDNRLAAAVVARITFNLVDGKLVASSEHPWIVSGPPWDGPQGKMDSDEVFRRGGVDLLVFGSARAPRNRAVSQMKVTMSVGAWSRTVQVTGERAWVRGGRQLRPTAPVPFTAIPLTMANAFGGKGEWDGLSCPFPENEHGKGYFLTEEAAVGGRLPNIEDPRWPVVAWTDRPAPVGVGPCPIISGQRMRNGILLDDKGRVVEILPKFFNAAFPEMIVDEVTPGDQVRIDGVWHEGPLTFSIPDVAPRAVLAFGGEVIQRDLKIDQVGIEADQSRVFITYRFPFRYVVHKMQLRSCDLVERPS
ncbi:MAG TPA: DUF2169 domain-containing protein [Polyangia bacterium]|nr:DUF2169 domain-containing protein [Polyangia bacterium]